MSMTDRVGLELGSISLPRRLRPGSSSSGVKMLLPLLVLGLCCSVGLKLTGERKPWVCVRRALGKVFRPEWRKKIPFRNSTCKFKDAWFCFLERWLKHPFIQYNLTIAVVLQTKWDVISPRIGSSLPCFFKHWYIVLCETAAQKHDRLRN